MATMQELLARASQGKVSQDERMKGYDTLNPDNLTPNMSEGERRARMMPHTRDDGTVVVPREKAGQITEDEYFPNPKTGQLTNREMLASRANTGQGTAAIAGGMQGAGFNFGDEAIGAAGRVLEGPGMGRVRREQARGVIDKAREENPWTYGTAEMGGAVTTGLATGAPLVNAARHSPMLTGGGIGAAEGFLHGAGRGEGMTDRLQKGGVGSAIGLPIGYMSPALANGISSAGRAAVDPLAGAMNMGNKGRGRRAVADALQRSGKTVDEVDDAVRQAAREGQPEFMVADALGRPGQRMLTGVAKQPGDAREEIAKFLTERQAGQSDRMSASLADAFDAQGTATQRVDDLTEARTVAANEAYGNARTSAGPVDVSGAVNMVDDRIGAAEGAGLRLNDTDRLLAQRRDELVGEGGQTIDFDRVLSTKKELSNDIGVAMRAGAADRARDLTPLKNALDEALEKSSPGYRAANDDFARASSEIDAVSQGSAAAGSRTRAADGIDQFNGMTPAQQDEFRRGYGDALIGKVEGQREGVNSAAALDTPKRKAEIAAYAKNPEVIGRQLDRERTMAETGHHALGGPATAENLADMAEVNMYSGPMMQAGSDLLRGNFGSAIGNLGYAAQPLLTGRNAGTREEIAKALLSRDPKAALGPALQTVETSGMKRRLLANMLRQAQGRSVDEAGTEMLLQQLSVK